MDSSSADVCSGEVPLLEGRRAEGDSFSTFGVENGQLGVEGVLDAEKL